MAHEKLMQELGTVVGLDSAAKMEQEAVVEPLKVKGHEAATIDTDRQPRWASALEAAKALKALIIDNVIDSMRSKDITAAAAGLQKIIAQAAMLASSLRFKKLEGKLLDLMANKGMWEERQDEGEDEVDEAKDRAAPVLHISNKEKTGTLCGISKEKAMKAKPPLSVVSQDDAGAIEPSERWCPKCLKIARDQNIKVNVKESAEGSESPFQGEAEPGHEGEKMVFGVWRDVGSSPPATAPAKPPATPAGPPPAPAKKAKRPTFDAAKEGILSHLEKTGWKVEKNLKVPHATSPDGKTRYWFKAQAVHKTVLDDPRDEPEYRIKKHDLGSARSTWGKDIRDIDPADFTKHH